MICSFVLGLYPQNEAEKIYKYTNYNYFKNLLLNEGFSLEELKKITISNFMTKDKFFEEKTYFIKISSICSECSLKLLKLLFLYKITSHSIFLKNTYFKITNIYHNSFWARQLDLEKFLDSDLKREIEINFITPAFFKIGNQYTAVSEPIYIFKNLIKKLKTSSINDKIILNSIKMFDITKIKIKEDLSEKRYIKSLGTYGIIGKIIFETDDTQYEQILLFNFLLYFSFFSGIGYITEKGYGQVLINSLN